MDFDLNEEQREFRNQVARFVEDRVAPRAEELDQSHSFPRELMVELGDLGCLGIKCPQECGGAGLEEPHVYHAIFCEELARGSLGMAAVLAMHTSTATFALYHWGSPELHRRYLVPALEGRKVGAFGLTEPGAGSTRRPSAPKRSDGAKAGS